MGSFSYDVPSSSAWDLGSGRPQRPKPVFRSTHAPLDRDPRSSHPASWDHVLELPPLHGLPATFLLPETSLPGIWAGCLGLFPCSVIQSPRTGSARGNKQWKNTRQTTGDSIHALGTTVSLVRERVPLPWGFRCLAIYHFCCTTQDCPGTGTGMNQRGKKAIIKKGTSSIFYLVGDPSPDP